jgi:hypothetical protein
MVQLGRLAVILLRRGEAEQGPGLKQQAYTRAVILLPRAM